MLTHRVFPGRAAPFPAVPADHRGDLFPDVVIGTTVSLSRNLAETPFTPVLSAGELTELRRKAQFAFDRLTEEFFCLDGSVVGRELRDFYRDRGVLDGRPAVPGTDPFSIVSRDGDVYAQIGGEDHFLLSAVAGGWNTGEALRRVQDLDRLLEDAFPWAASLRIGYLSPRIEAAGTGLTVETVLFLPALHRADSFAAGSLVDWKRVKLELFAGGAFAGTALYRLRCTALFPETETETIALLEDSVTRLVHYERAAREELGDRHSLQLSDAAHRALGVLVHARTLSAEEAADNTGLVRFGVATGILTRPDRTTATELLFFACDSTVRVFPVSGDTTEEQQDEAPIDVRRATAVRALLRGEGIRWENK